MKKPQIFEIRNKSKIAPQMSILEMVTTPIFATIFNSGNPETSSPPPPQVNPGKGSDHSDYHRLKRNQNVR